MDPRDDLLQERLARLEAGEHIDTCLKGLPEEEAAMIKKAACLRTLASSQADSVSASDQRRAFLRFATENIKTMPQASAPNKSRPAWVFPVALAGAGFSLVSCVIMLALIAGLFGYKRFIQSRNVEQNTTPVTQNTVVPGSAALPGSTPTGAALTAPETTPETTPTAAIAVLDAPDALSAALIDPRGLVEVQSGDGAWVPAGVSGIVTSGQRVRTGVLSSATLKFYDGSQVRLDPKSEISVDELNAQRTGPRVIVLTQWLGESDHDVAASTDAASRYEVGTPSATGTAKGTKFHVFVSITLLVRFDVYEGVVEVNGFDESRSVVAGQSTLIVNGTPPIEPYFRISGEGKVETVENGWHIAGRLFQLDENSVIVGNPEPGDWVSFDARTMPDGKHYVNSIILLSRMPENRFEFTGVVDAVGAGEWKVAGRVVRVDDKAEIDNDIQAGDRVEVRGIIDPDGKLLAWRIRLLEDALGLPFEFTGVVETAGDSAWTISGILITVDGNTQVGTGIAAGDMVRVKGSITAEGIWLAKSILRSEEDEREFVVTGRVEQIDPWRVSGMGFSTSSETEIDDEIKSGDRVRVEGRIKEDGSWLALDIQQLGENHPYRFSFVGIVTSIDPLIVGSTLLAVDEHTQIPGDVLAGDRVRAIGWILSDGTWIAVKIQRLETYLGCLSLSNVVRSINGSQVSLLDWKAFNLEDNIHVEGELKTSAVIIIYGCTRPDRTFMVVNVIVIYQLDQYPFIIAPKSHDDDGDDDDDDDDDDD